MTVCDLDRATIEVLNSVNEIMAKYGLTPSLMAYSLNTVMTKLTDFRIAEYIDTIDSMAKPREEPPKKNSVKLGQIQEMLKQKIENGELEADGKAHVRLSELRANDDNTDD